MEENEVTSRYFRYIKICGCLIGTWPFQTKRSKTIARWFMCFLIFSALFTQLSRVALFYTFDTLAEQIPFIGVALSSAAKFFNCVLNEQRITQILLSMYADWKHVDTEEETAVMQTYAERALLFSFLYKLNIYFACVTFGSLPFVPRILDVVKPLNESRQWLLVYPAYYYVDQNKYYYYLLGHTLFCMVASALTLLFADGIIIYMVQHSCSLLSVAGYRFKHTVDKKQHSTLKNSESPSDVHRKLRSSIESHNRAMEIITEIESIYAVNLFLQVCIAMITFSITLLMIALKSFTLDMCPVYGFIIVQLIHLLFLTIQGQFVNNVCDSIYIEIYEALWYNAHPKLQAFYALALRKSLTPPILTAGGLIKLNLNSFAEILKASVSYYTVLRSS